MKGIEADAPVFIILGVLTVLVGLSVVFGITDNFAGQSGHSNEEALTSLIGDIEQKCSDLDQYNTIVSTTNNFELHGATVTLGQNFANLDADINVEKDIECSETIDYDYEGSEEDEIELESGVYDITVGSEDDNVHVEVN